MKKPHLIAYTDGSCWPNPGPGGYGTLILLPTEIQEYSAGYRLTTNNRMELRAVLVALQQTSPRYPLTVYSDSKYVVNGLNYWMHSWAKRGWLTATGTPVVNVDLWQKLFELNRERRVEYLWVKGHNGDKHNERCDVLAAEAERNLIDEVYENG